ncbi:MAG: alpha-amylase family protein, partial [Kiritimatiellia bacterium]|nr:alpha-amylase family protein [Kiritimatiellia bacterium]
KEDYLLIYCQRPQVGYQATYTMSGMFYEFLYFTQFLPGQNIHLPSVTIEWGRGLEDAHRRIAGLFRHYEEPAEWWYHTTWAHMEFPDFREAVGPLEILAEAGLNGIWITGHSRPRGYYGTSPESYQPDALLGGEKAYAKLMKRADELGFRKMVWFSGCGFLEGKDYKPSWGIRGVDGRHWVAWGNTYQEHIVGCNPLDPSWQDYTLKWILRYIEDYGIDGIFLDCGAFCFPPDFGEKQYQKYPSQSLVGYIDFLDRIHAEARRRKKDFVMFLEGAHSDLSANAFTIVADRPSYTGRSGLDFIESLRRYDLRICYWSGKAYDLASGMPFINPTPLGITRGDRDKTMADIKEIANGKMNRFICNLVREKGCRDAVRFGPNISKLGDLLVCNPDFSGELSIPAKAGEGCVLKDLLNETSQSLHFDSSGRITFKKGEGVYELH